MTTSEFAPAGAVTRCPTCGGNGFDTYLGDFGNTLVNKQNHCPNPDCEGGWVAYDTTGPCNCAPNSDGLILHNSWCGLRQTAAWASRVCPGDEVWAEGFDPHDLTVTNIRDDGMVDAFGMEFNDGRLQHAGIPITDLKLIVGGTPNPWRAGIGMELPDD